MSAAMVSQKGALEVRFAAAHTLIAVCNGASEIIFDADMGPVDISLHQVYDDVVGEPIPQDMLDLLGKLD